MVQEAALLLRGAAELAPRYALLRDQMGYDGLLYSTKWNDPTWQYVGW